MKELTIIEISPLLCKLTCEGGRVLDTRNNISFKEVVCKKEEIKYYIAI